MPALPSASIGGPPLPVTSGLSSTDAGKRDHLGDLVPADIALDRLREAAGLNGDPDL